MSLLLYAAGALAVALLFYLVVALLAPERLS
ncbi:MAG: potassium-transporting ATPase subunit F [Polyangiaceae bacterium]|jgi:K+-transporting ATPase KdpF subunit|nr:potassium-transporting ATPase subunit F [Polyangiaceae bacterium]MBK8940253.1 potassium-transporting ATPase subunit F [Polyangiaceae bacterium]